MSGGRLKTLVISLLLSIFIITDAKAFSFNEIGAQGRNFLELILGSERVASWFSSPEEPVQMPPLPDVIENSRSTEAYERKESEDKYDDELRYQYNLTFIRELYQVVRNERATRDDQARWMNTLGQGGSREGVYRALVLDNAYAGKENYGPIVNQELIEFTRSFMQKFTGREVKVESLQEMSFYTLKRVVTEQIFSIINELLIEEDHLFRWYGNFSSDLAVEYPQLWENEVRARRSTWDHYYWAKEVPTQHIKSEVIIKLHKVMNYLMGIS